MSRFNLILVMLCTPLLAGLQQRGLLIPDGKLPSGVNVWWDEKALSEGRLAGTLEAHGEDIVFYLGTREWIAEQNDFHMRPPVIDVPMKLARNRFTFKDVPLTPRGWIHLKVMCGGKTLCDIEIPYDLRDFAIAKILHAYANADHSKMLVTIAVPDASTGFSWQLAWEDGDGVARINRQGQAKGKELLTLPLNGIQPSNGTLKLTLMDREKRIFAEDTGPFAILPEHPEWWGNSIGKTNGTVPFPWMPMAIVDSTVIHVWNRFYSLDGIGMPSKICSAGGREIARNFRFTSNGRPFTPTHFAWKSHAGDISEFEAEAILDRHTLHLRGTIEFDGAILFDCHFHPAEGQRLPDVTLEYDVPASLAKIVYAGEHIGINSGLLKSAVYSKKLLDQPMLWVGDENEGIYFCADDLRGWSLSNLNAPSAFVLPAKDGIRTVSIKLLEQSANREGEAYMPSFALLATPSRPLPVGYRTWQINGGSRQTHHFYAKGLTELFNIPASYRNGASRVLMDWNSKSIIAPVYLAFLTISPFTDEYRWFAESWTNGDPKASYNPPNSNEHNFVCPSAPGFNEWYLHSLDRLLSETGAKDIYFDYAQPTTYPCKGLAHGCFWKDRNGIFHSSLRLRAARKLAKRIYVRLKSEHPDGMVVFHNSGSITPFVHAFCDVTWRGEETTHRMYENNLSYHGIFEPEKFRAEYNQQNWGVPCVFLPQYLRALQAWQPNYFGDYKNIGWNGMWNGFNTNPVHIKDTWYLAAYIYLHNASFSGDWGMWTRQEDITAAQEKIGWDDTVQFRGYYSDECFWTQTKPENDKVMVSSYKASKGEMVVCLNDSHIPQELTISAPPGYEGRTLKNLADSSEITVQEGCFTLQMLPCSGVFLVLFEW